MEPWTTAQRTFSVKAFYTNGDSFVIAQRDFRREFGIHRNRAVQSAHAINTWVRHFEATGSALKKKGGCGSVIIVRIPENTWGDPKITIIFFLEGRGALVPPAPAWCVYVTARRISWPRGILGERSTWLVWFFSWVFVIAFVDFSMPDLKEQRVCVKFCFLLGKTAETVTMLREAFKEEA